MPNECECGQEINDSTEICPGCGANVRALSAELQLKIRKDAIVGWRATVEEKDAEIATLKEEAVTLHNLADARMEEIERLSKRDGNATIELVYGNGDNPFAREELKHVDFGVADNGYVVESKLVADLQTRIAELEAVLREHMPCGRCKQPTTCAYCNDTLRAAPVRVVLKRGE